MRKLKLFVLLFVSLMGLYSSLTYCMQENHDGTLRIEEGYKCQVDPLLVQNTKAKEKFTLNGNVERINSLIIKADYVICSAVVLLHRFDEATGYRTSKAKNYVYIWDLQKKYRLCGLCNFLKSKLNLDLNYLIGLNPVAKIACNFNVENINFIEDYRLAVTQRGNVILKPSKKMRNRLKKSDRKRNYQLLRKQEAINITP